MLHGCLSSKKFNRSRVKLVMMNSAAAVSHKGRENALTTLPLIDLSCNRKERRKRTVHHLPCICFGSTQYRIAAPYEVSQSLNNKKHPRKVVSLRAGMKPTIGELNLSDKNKKLNDINQRKKTKDSESLLLICQKVEHIKNMHKDDRWCVGQSAPFKFDIPAFPAREEFVFRNRYRNELPSKLPPRFLKTLSYKDKIVS